jgi:hypothetical protein
MYNDTLTATARLLHEFSEPNGFKFLTHDIKSEGVDYVEFVYRAEKTLLGRMYESTCDRKVFDLVRGFIFGPSWIDSEGKTRKGFCSCSDWVSYYERTGNHPMANPEFEDDINAYRKTIRFRDGQLGKFFRLLGEHYPKLNITLDPAIRGADFYVDVRRLKVGIAEIIGMMAGYADEHPNVHVGFDDCVDGNYSVAKITITQEGSFPPPSSIDRIYQRFLSGAGNLASIAHILEGCCRWSVISPYWGMHTSSPFRWRILPSGPGTSICPGMAYDDIVCRGFTHEIEIVYLP